jgi:hypothetical protein
MKYLACHENTIHDILSEWPSLKLSLGYKLVCYFKFCIGFFLGQSSFILLVPFYMPNVTYFQIEADFDAMHPNRGLNLFKKWPIFMVKALPHLRKLKSSEVNILDENPAEGRFYHLYYL